MKPVVAIVGRPNVGKSTLFNRLIGNRQAIVDNEPGLTRDRMYGQVEWNGKQFSLIDTGGLLETPSTSIEQAVRHQANVAIEEADLILFVVDGRTGPVASDEEVADIIRKSSKKALLIINKIDDYQKQSNIVWDFFGLGFDEPILISAEHGLGTGDLLDQILISLPSFTTDHEEAASIKLAVIGRPNVGKSSLVNTLLGKERVIVDDQPGTTRDSIDTFFHWNGTDFTLIDTAGLRRRGKIGRGIEKYSAIRTHRSVDEADVVLILFDIGEGLVEQDKKVAGIAHEQGKGIVLVINKMDLSRDTPERISKTFFQAMPFLQYAPIVCISAKEGTGIEPLLETVLLVDGEWKKRIKTGVLNEVLHDAFALTPPPSSKGKRLKLFYSTQVAVSPPTFILFVNNPDIVHFSYVRYLENQLRRAFGFVGSPLWIKFRQRGDD